VVVLQFQELLAGLQLQFVE
jgi:hypothetical protein